MKIFTPFVALILAGCMQTDAAPLSQVPVENITLAGQYTAIANCAYQRLDKASGNGIKKIDLANETRLALESGGVRYWELTFTPAGKQTAVAFTQAQTMWGPLGSKEVMQLCEPAGASAAALAGNRRERGAKTPAGAFAHDKPVVLLRIAADLSRPGHTGKDYQYGQPGRRRLGKEKAARRRPSLFV